MNLSLTDRLALRRGEDADRGDLVQTVLLIAGFAIVAILIVTWLGTAILNKGSDAANCIQNSDVAGNTSSQYITDHFANQSVTVQHGALDACNDNAASTHGFQSDAGYQNRYN